MKWVYSESPEPHSLFFLFTCICFLFSHQTFFFQSVIAQLFSWMYFYELETVIQHPQWNLSVVRNMSPEEDSHSVLAI